MNILRIGDPHVMISNLKESEKLIDFVVATALDRKINTIEFLGDLFHTHAVMRVEIVDFWQKAFEKIELAGLECRVLVGNHDQPGSREKEQVMNALNIFKDDGTADCMRMILNEPTIVDGIAYIPYMSNKEEFLKASQDLYSQGATKLLVAHQTFTGAQYDNGFYAEDGIDPSLVAQDAIISGHIHANQQIGKCDYPGTAKWDNMSDANKDKGIWIYTHNEDRSVASKEFISTSKVLTPIYKHTMIEGEKEAELFENAKNYIELVGKSAWITKMKKKYKNKAQIKARPTDRKIGKIDKFDNISIYDYLRGEMFSLIDGVETKDVVSYLENVSGSN